MPVLRSLPVVATLVLLAIAPARAATVTVAGTISRGDLSTIFPPGLMQLPLVDLDSGGDQQIYLDLPFTVADMRGSGAGWSLNVASNGFTQSLVPMPGTTATMVGATTQCHATEVCTLPQTSVDYPLPVLGDQAPVRFFNAATGSGMGTTDLSARMAVTVPGNALIGDFETTLTLTQSAGP
jgi:hypothetical protein